MIKELFKGEYKRYTIVTITACILSIGLGVLWHFLFDLCGENAIIGLFAPINESVWEHIKILYFPFMISMVVEYFIYGRGIYNFFSSKALGLTLGMISIITLFYVAVGALGVNNMVSNISIFTVSALLSYAVSYLQMIRTPRCAGGVWEWVAIFVLCLYLALFLIFSYYPPHIPLFRDPTNMQYSIEKKKIGKKILQC